MPVCDLVARLPTTVHRPKSQIAVYSKLQFEGLGDLNHNRWQLLLAVDEAGHSTSILPPAACSSRSPSPTMPTAKDVRDILEVPAAGPSKPQTTSPKPGFTLKLPPGRAVSFLKPSDPPAAAEAAAAPPLTTSPISNAASNVAAESSGEAQRYRRAKNPDGIVRDLYALIGDNAPSLLQTRTEVGEGVASKASKDRLTKRVDPAAKWYVSLANRISKQLNCSSQATYLLQSIKSPKGHIALPLALAQDFPRYSNTKTSG